MKCSISSLIATAESGNRTASEELFAALYSELYRLARVQLSRSSGALTLGTTTLLHEAYLDIAGREGAVFPDRDRFMAYASRAMRGLIIDYVRKRKAQKRGSCFELTSIEVDVADRSTDNATLIEISDALDELATVDPRLVQVVDLKFFCGLSFIEIAGMWNLSERTVQRHWERARIYLYKALARSR